MPKLVMWERDTLMQKVLPLFASAFCIGLVFCAIDIVLPLWLTGSMGYSAADWARVRSMRMVGILLAVIVLGGLSDRFGQRRLGWLSLVVAGMALAALALGRPVMVWILVPVIGGCISTAFVNMNTLIQGISRRRQGAVNSAYRGVHAVTGILAPIAVTSLAVWFGGYPRVLLLCAVLMLLAALWLRRFPREAVAPVATLREEFRGMYASYAKALRERPLMLYLGLSIAWIALTSVVGSFAAIRFVRELGISDQAFGGLSTAGGVLTLGAVLVSGLVLDRLPLRRLTCGVSVGASLCTLGMGLTDEVVISALAFCLYVPLAGALVAPLSMWISRASGRASQTAAFSVQKVVAGGGLGIAVALQGWLEPHLGIAALLVWGGALSLLPALALGLIAEPPAVPRPADGIETF